TCRGDSGVCVPTFFAMVAFVILSLLLCLSYPTTLLNLLNEINFQFPIQQPDDCLRELLKMWTRCMFIESVLVFPQFVKIETPRSIRCIQLIHLASRLCMSRG